MSALDKVFGAPDKANGGEPALSSSTEHKIEPAFFNELAHQLVTVAMSQVGRSNDRAVHDLLQASRVVLDLDPRR